ncbi:hypothetical protein HDU76_011572, partial [Blyttiomyces sp. JEL0837]
MTGQQQLQQPQPAEKNWWDDFPKTISKPEGWTREQVSALVKDPTKIPGKDYLVVDVRRADYVGGSVKGSINVHAQTFYPTLEEFVNKHKHIPMVFFYCNSSNGRGPRCAAWYQDVLDAKGITSSRGMVLSGGIIGWVQAYGEDSTLTEAYDA